MPLSALLSQYSTILPIFVFLILIKKVKDWHLWVIFFYCIYSFANDALLIYRAKHDLPYRTYLYIWTILEYLIFSVYLYSILINKVLRTALLVLSVLFTVFCFYFIINEPLKQFDSLQTAISAILLISFCIIYFFEQINQPQLTLVYASYHFWIVIGILIYLCCTFFLFVFASRLPANEIDNYWIINHIGNILRNLLFATAILIYVKSLKTPPTSKSVEPEYQPFLN